jgi:hypothetical protein
MKLAYFVDWLENQSSENQFEVKDSIHLGYGAALTDTWIQRVWGNVVSSSGRVGFNYPVMQNHVTEEQNSQLSDFATNCIWKCGLSVQKNLVSTLVAVRHNLIQTNACARWR